MNFLTMDYFLVAARERSFTKAAQQLHITQQTLSAHIAAVERELGCQLFLRRVPLELTYAGEVFLRYAQQFQSGYISLQREFQDIAGRERGKLRVGVAYTRGRLLMPTLIEAFQREHPGIEVCLQESQNEDIVRSLLDGETDLAIARFPDEVQGLAVEEFYTTDVLLLIPNTLLEERFGPRRGEVEAALDAGDLSALAGAPFLLGGAGDVNGQMGEILIRRYALRPNVRARTENVETLVGLCAAGVGACFAPRDLMAPALREAGEEKVRVWSLGEEARFSVRFAYLRREWQWSALTEFIRIARQHAPLAAE